MLEANDISIEQAAIGRVCPPQWTRVSGCVVGSPTSSWVVAEPRPKTVLVHFVRKLTHMVTTNIIFNTFVTRRKGHQSAMIIGGTAPILGARDPVPPKVYTHV